MLTSSTRGQSVKRNALLQQWATPVTRAIFSLMLAAAASSATAMGLGAIHVRSNLGEPLNAEIDITALTEAEANGLKANIAPAAQYSASGLEMSTSLLGASVTLQRRADGRPYLRISGSRPVNDPFVDLVIETDNSESGRAVRGYTVLIDPPPSIYTVPKLTPPVIASRREPVAAPVITRPVTAPVVQSTELEATRAPVEGKAAKPRPAQTASESADSLRVRRGETAGALARRYASEQGVSFDQMLAALLRNNPDAFIGGNVNLLKAGAVVQVPTGADASSVSIAQAKREWTAHGRNFQEYRRKLAKVASKRVDASADRSASGAVDTQISDETRAAKARDKLMLGKGKTKANVDKELRQRSDKESKARVAELSKNLQELSKLSGAGAGSADKTTAGVKAPVAVLVTKTPAAKVDATKVPATTTVNTTVALAAPQLTASTKPAAVASPTAVSVAAPIALAASAAAAVATAASARVSAASAAVAAMEPASAASAALAAASSAASAASAAASAAAESVMTSKVVVQPVAAEPSMMDQLSDYALPLAGLLAALGLGGGLAWFMRRRKQRGGGLDSADFLESKLQADSFFDASGGQRIDTASSRSTEGASSSMVYSPSQLDAAGDVDPVAEAGVYMAYNRDQQAEDILKEAMRITPSRVAIYTTLMDIYGKRGDLKAFDVVAKEAYHLTQGQGDEWAKAVALGMEFDAKNPMYGAAQADASDSSPAPEFEQNQVSRPHAAPTSPMPLEPSTPKIEASDLDIAFRVSEFKNSEAHSEPAAPAYDMSAATMPMRITPTPTPQAQAAAEPSMDLEFDDVTTASDLTPHTSADALFTEEGLTNSGRAPLGQAPAAPTFDLGDLSLDLDPVPVVAVAPVVSDPWMTKLELAREFAALGDNEGARGLADEVVANAPDAIANQARTFISTMI